MDWDAMLIFWPKSSFRSIAAPYFASPSPFVFGIIYVPLWPWKGWMWQKWSWCKPIQKYSTYCCWFPWIYWLLLEHPFFPLFKLLCCIQVDLSAQIFSLVHVSDKLFYYSQGLCDICWCIWTYKAETAEDHPWKP